MTRRWYRLPYAVTHRWYLLLDAVTRRWYRLLDALLGPRCICGQRVYPRDEAAHRRDEHAGDEYEARWREGT